ncbi:MAG: alpha/beta fold hydrolase [Proteobacteria bacterium]|nr:MAG: alpha/beta fold hydrolase [Pseudomonadota bacterium]
MELSSLILIMVSLFALFNIMALLHVRGILHFHDKGMSATAPESLSFGSKVRIALFGMKILKPKGHVDRNSLNPAFAHARFKSSDSIEIDAWISAPTFRPCWVLMLHGFVAEKTALLKEAEAFQEIGLRPFLIDFRGSGESSGYDTSIGYKEAEDVKAAVDYIRREFPLLPIVIYGKSMGAAAALRAVGVLGVKVEALILECPFDNLLATLKNRFRLIAAPPTPFAQILLFWGSVLYRFNGFKHNPEDFARSVKIPTLVIGGANDNRAKPEEVTRVFHALAGKKQLEIVLNAGHNELYDSAAETWKRTISTFINRDVLTD